LSHEVIAIQFGDIDRRAGEILIRSGTGPVVAVLHGFPQE